MTTLSRIHIVFNTHNDDKDGETVLHVFVKNRSNTTSTPEADTDYISNHLAYLSYERPDFAGINPYLGRAENINSGVTFGNSSTFELDIPLRSRPIPLAEIVLPVVNIHILPSGDDQWIFSYTITFFFSDGRNFAATSDANGVNGIILDQDNRNYSGICTENPFPLAPFPVYLPQTTAVLTGVRMVFYTHTGDGTDDKDEATQVNIHVVNRLSASSNQDIAIGLNVLPGQQFTTGSLNTVVFGQNPLPLASNTIKLHDIVLPQVTINIAPNGNDTWKFDYRIFFNFSNGQTFYSETNGIVLSQDIHKYSGVYQGKPFPTATPPGKPQLFPVPVNHMQGGAKKISFSFLQKKLDDFINTRQGGITSQNPPIRRVYLDNSGAFSGTLPESYYDIQAIDADPPLPGTLSPPGYIEGIRYNNNPTSVGQRTQAFGLGDVYLNNILSNNISVKVDASSPTPVTVKVAFDCSVPNELVGGTHESSAGMDLTGLSLSVPLSATRDRKAARVDLLNWVPTGPNNVDVVLQSSSGLAGKASAAFSGAIHDALSNPVGNFDTTTGRDGLNSVANSWLLGGVLTSDTDVNGMNYKNGCVVNSVTVQGDNLVIDYSGPANTFSPPTPATWPPANFTPGNLANIDHIVVLTMENRSFDHMLGYLSLPVANGGMGRKDVDGLQGGEVNFANGIPCPSAPFKQFDTIFSPDPPHSYEPVSRAINGGKMDGFAQAYCDNSGPEVAPRIMMYHTGANVPVYDALARDFAIGHRWFASHPGPTFCNRFYELTGRLNIDPDGFWEFSNSSPLRPVFTSTIFDYLSQAGVSWKYFENFYCFLRFFEAHTFDTENIAPFDDPEFGFANLARTGNLPSVSFIDPHFIELPPGGNCDGPPADVKQGQALVQQVVEAVVSSPLWSKTLLLITYDEHGGFYDHVPPPGATPVSTEPEPISTYGVRVPAFIVSPWVNAGSVFGHDGVTDVVGGVTKNAETPGNPVNPVGPVHPLHFDHTSTLKTIARRFLSENPPYMGARYADAQDLSSVIGNVLHQGQFLPFIGYNIVYGTSKMGLEVAGGVSSPGAALCQYTPNTTVAQLFTFEDAGGGFFYIRTRTGNLYVTAIPAVDKTQLAVVRQEPKYAAGGTGAQIPDLQKWKLTSTSASVAGANIVTITNAAVPGKVLQPSGNGLTSGIAVVLGNPIDSHLGITVNPNGWQVSSPLLANNQTVRG